MGERHGDAIVFRDWSGGEFGILDPGVAGRSEKQMFTGDNVLRYRTGLLGPRPGLKTVTFTSPPDGTPLGSGTTSSGSLWVLTQTGGGYEVREWNPDTGVVGSAYSGSLPAAVPFAIKTEVANGTGSWISVPSAGVYKLNHTSDAASLVDTDPAGFVITQYGLRAVANTGSRLWYSNANDPDTWGAASYLDLSGFSISFMAPFRDGMIVGTAGGIFHILTGVLGATTVVRELSRGGSPVSPFHALRVADDKVWFYNQAEPYPSMFNGAIHQRFDYLTNETVPTASFNGKLPFRNMQPTTWAGTNDWFTYGLQNGHSFQNDVLTMHTFSSLSDTGLGSVTDLGTHHLLLDSNGTGDPLTAYRFAPGLKDRPAFVGDDYAQPGDGSDTPLNGVYFQTPEWWEDAGHQVRVSQVIVDFVAWDTGTVDSAYFEITLDMLHRTGAAATKFGSSVVGLDEPVSSFTTSAAGTPGRIEKNMTEGYGAGFQVTISDIANCAIRNVIVVPAPDSSRP